MSFGTVQAEQMTTQSGFTLGAGNASSFKNRIINGAVTINQRGTTNSAAVDGAYFMDMYATITNNGMTFNIGQNLNSVTPPAGFSYYVGCQSTSSGAVPSGTTTGVRVRIEGYNMADLAWGTANAKAVTMSFWVYSSLTGTFAGGLWNPSQSTSYPFTYSIPVANTWTYVTVSITGPTSGTFLTTNTAGLGIDFGLAIGSSYQGTAGAWGAGFKIGVSGMTQVCSTSSATWYMTGLQFEVGTVATSFDFQDYGKQLALCQRYLPTVTSHLASNNTYSGAGFYKNNTTAVQLAFSFVVPSRIPPTGLTVGSGASFTVINPASVNAFGCTSPAFNTAGFTWALIDATTTSGIANSPLYWLINGGASASNAYFTGAEL